MSELELHQIFVTSEYIFAVLTFLILLFITAPYGRHFRQGWGPSIPNYLGWILMEFPTVILFLLFFFLGDHCLDSVPLILLGMWQSHYVYRTFVFPFRMRSSKKEMPLLIAVLGFAFNTLNGWLNASWISQFGTYSSDWLTDPRFLFGSLIFCLGFAGNIHSDEILRNLRSPGETKYKIPRGGLYKWVSSPNYLCETLEWTGWAIATWSSAGFAFAFYTAANLIPRALVNHKWYHNNFETYPKERKAFLPYLF